MSLLTNQTPRYKSLIQSKQTSVTRQNDAVQVHRSIKFTERRLPLRLIIFNANSNAQLTIEHCFVPTDL